MIPIIPLKTTHVVDRDAVLARFAGDAPPGRVGDRLYLADDKDDVLSDVGI